MCVCVVIISTIILSTLTHIPLCSGMAVVKLLMAVFKVQGVCVCIVYVWSDVVGVYGGREVGTKWYIDD